MNIEEMIDRAREAMGARRVYGEPVTHGEVVVIPAARVLSLIHI